MRSLKFQSPEFATVGQTLVPHADPEVLAVLAALDKGLTQLSQDQKRQIYPALAVVGAALEETIFEELDLPDELEEILRELAEDQRGRP